MFSLMPYKSALVLQILALKKRSAVTVNMLTILKQKESLGIEYGV